MVHAFVRSYLNRVPRIGALLLGRKLISEPVLAGALRQQHSGRRLGEILLAQGAITRFQLTRCLGLQAFLKGVAFLGAVLMLPEAAFAGGCSVAAPDCAEMDQQNTVNYLQAATGSWGAGQQIDVSSAYSVKPATKHYQWNLSSLSAANSGKSQNTYEDQLDKLAVELKNFVAAHTSPLVVTALKGEHKGGALDGTEGVGYRMKWSSKSLNFKVTYSF